MNRNCLVSLAALFLAVSVSSAAEPIKVPLKDFKLKAKLDGTPDTLLGWDETENKIFFYTFGLATAEVQFPDDGEYTIVIEASCDEAKKEKAKIKVTLGDDVVTKEFELKETTAKEYSFPVKAKKGSPKLVIEFLNDEFKEGEFDRNLYLHAVKIEKKK